MAEDQTLHTESSHPAMPAYGTAAVIKVLSGPLQGEAYPLGAEEYLIGRDPKSHIVIEDKSVSRKHAAIVKKGSEYLLRDMGSTNGIFVNNLKMERAVLRSGDIFQIGSCVFQFFWNRHRPKT